MHRHQHASAPKRPRWAPLTSASDGIEAAASPSALLAPLAPGGGEAPTTDVDSSSSSSSSSHASPPAFAAAASARRKRVRNNGSPCEPADEAARCAVHTALAYGFPLLDHGGWREAADGADGGPSPASPPAAGSGWASGGRRSVRFEDAAKAHDGPVTLNAAFDKLVWDWFSGVLMHSGDADAQPQRVPVPVPCEPTGPIVDWYAARETASGDVAPVLQALRARDRRYSPQPRTPPESALYLARAAASAAAGVRLADLSEQDGGGGPAGALAHAPPCTGPPQLPLHVDAATGQQLEPRFLQSQSPPLSAIDTGCRGAQGPGFDGASEAGGLLRAPAAGSAAPPAGAGAAGASSCGALPAPLLCAAAASGAAITSPTTRDMSTALAAVTLLSPLAAAAAAVVAVATHAHAKPTLCGPASEAAGWPVSGGGWLGSSSSGSSSGSGSDEFEDTRCSEADAYHVGSGGGGGGSGGCRSLAQEAYFARASTASDVEAQELLAAEEELPLASPPSRRQQQQLGRSADGSGGGVFERHAVTDTPTEVGHVVVDSPPPPLQQPQQQGAAQQQQGAAQRASSGSSGSMMPDAACAELGWGWPSPSSPFCRPRTSRTHAQWRQQPEPGDCSSPLRLVHALAPVPAPPGTAAAVELLQREARYAGGDRLVLRGLLALAEGLLSRLHQGVLRDHAGSSDESDRDSDLTRSSGSDEGFGSDDDDELSARVDAEWGYAREEAAAATLAGAHSAPQQAQGVEPDSPDGGLVYVYEAHAQQQQQAAGEQPVPMLHDLDGLVASPEAEAASLAYRNKRALVSVPVLCGGGGSAAKLAPRHLPLAVQLVYCLRHAVAAHPASHPITSPAAAGGLSPARY